MRRVTLLCHRGVAADGPALQTSSKDPDDLPIVRLGPLNLQQKPVTPYRRYVLERIATLVDDGWTNRQIAEYFNARGVLTARGRVWTTGLVWSVRRKVSSSLRVPKLTNP